LGARITGGKQEPDRPSPTALQFVRSASEVHPGEDPVQPGKQQRREGRADHAIAPGGPKKDLI